MILIKNRRIANILLRDIYRNKIKIAGLDILGFEADIIGRDISQITLLIGYKFKEALFNTTIAKENGWFMSLIHKETCNFNRTTTIRNEHEWNLILKRLPPRKIYELNNKENGETR